MRFDLHVHTTASDGTRDAPEVIDLAVDGGLDVVSITDHDTVAGLDVAMTAAADRPIQVIAGIEVSSTWDGAEYHILGYFVDPEAASVKGHERRAVEGRERRMKEMVDRLRQQGLMIVMDDVTDEAGPNRFAIGRPHLARALVSRGYANSVADAFDRLIGDRHPAFVPTRLAAPDEAIQLIVDGGGIPVWAHPPRRSFDRLLPEFVRAGLRGVEVYRPRSEPKHIEKLRRAAESFDLLVSGGSDWHDPDRGVGLGDFFVTEDQVGALLEAGER
jgi:predicted metal-dependent phosphoesterase TrpH